MRAAALLLLAACGQTAGDGYAVDLTIVYDSSVSDGAVATVDTYAFHFGGAESGDKNVPVAGAHRTERVVLKLAHSGPSLDITLDARAGGSLVASGAVSVPLKAGATVAATLTLATSGAVDDLAMPDLAGPQDLTVAEDLSALPDLAELPDLTAEVDLTPGPDLADQCHLVINEVATGQNGVATDEWVEIYNPCGNDISLSNSHLGLRDINNVSDNYTVPLGGTIPANSYITVGNSTYSPSPDFKWGTADRIVGPAGGGIQLRGGGSVVIDSMAWKSSTNVVPTNGCTEGTPTTANLATGDSMARTPNGNDTNDNGADFMLDATPTFAAANN